MINKNDEDENRGRTQLLRGKIIYVYHYHNVSTYCRGWNGHFFGVGEREQDQ